MELPRSPLEDWLREDYFTAEIDVSGSGVHEYSFRELRELVGLTSEDLDAVVFRDSATLGGGELRQAIAARWANGASERVMATNGSTEAIFMVMYGLLKPGDEVVVLDPCYPQLASLAEGLGCRMKRWNLRFERQFRPDLQELQDLLSPDTKMVVVNFPHNPTGASMTEEEQKALVDAVGRRGAYLIWDAAFAELTYEGPALPDPTFWYERAITLGTLSKGYGLPGLRVGWLIASPEILQRFVVLRDYTTLALSPLVELVAVKAVENADVLLAPRLEQAASNRRLFGEWIERHRDVAAWVPPRGGVSGWVRLTGIADARALCRKLFDERGVLLSPGDCFGAPSYVRLGFGCPEATLRKGLAVLSEQLSPARAAVLVS